MGPFGFEITRVDCSNKSYQNTLKRDDKGKFNIDNADLVKSHQLQCKKTTTKKKKQLSEVGDRAWFVRLYGEIIPEL